MVEQKIKVSSRDAAKMERGKRRGRRGEKTREEIVSAWKPKTELGKQVKEGKIKSIDEILDNKRKILEGEIVDYEDYKIEHGLEDVIFVHYRRK